jgi:hypothetical protein
VLYEKYKDAGLAVVAVNAYDESEEAVAEFAEQQKLAYTIALMGRTVAEKTYAVGAYPTSFWVDHSGTIVDYVVGFDPGDEVRMAAKIERLLQARDAK